MTRRLDVDARAAARRTKVPRRVDLEVRAAARRPKVPRRRLEDARDAARQPRAPVELEVRYAARRPWVPGRRQLAGWAGAAAAAVRRPALSICVVGLAQSRSLNARYRGRDYSTNVLSFAGAGLAPDGRCFLGELVICAPVVAHEARAQGKTLAAHWAHMTVHGVLHLLGFDHEAAAEARKMAAREVQVLDQLGFSDPYR